MRRAVAQVAHKAQRTDPPPHTHTHVFGSPIILEANRQLSLTFCMGGSLLLSLCTASRVSMCIWTMSVGEEKSHLQAPLASKHHLPSPACPTATWDHDMQSLEVLIGDSTLSADLVHKTVDEADHVVGHVGALGILKATFGVIAVSHTAGNAAEGGRALSSSAGSRCPNPWLACPSGPVAPAAAERHSASSLAPQEGLGQAWLPVSDEAVADALRIAKAGAPQEAVLAGVQGQQEVAHAVGIVDGLAEHRALLLLDQLELLLPAHGGPQATLHRSNLQG